MLDILILERTSSGRDHEVISLLSYYLRENFTVKIRSIFEAELYIQILRPKLILMMNPYGSLFHFEVLTTISRYKIPIITIIAEGNFSVYEYESAFWGWNYKCNIVESLYLIWSKNSKNIILKNNPNLNNKIKITGAIGFDRYTIYRYKNREQFFKKYNLNYQYCIGIAGWAFGACYNNSPRYVDMKKIYGEDQCNRFRYDGISLNSIYRQLIENNPEILFLLKFHPGQSENEISEFTNNYDLTQLKNTFIVKNEMPISECINISDLWIGYESTTCMEAWLLKKTTLYINPSGSKFLRNVYFKGNPIAETYIEAQKLIEEYFLNNRLVEFDKKKSFRDSILGKVLQWDDGKNHIRAGYLISEFAKNIKRHQLLYLKCFNLKLFILALMHFISRYKIFCIFPRVYNLREYSTLFQKREIMDYDKVHYPQWKNFFKNNNLNSEDINDLIQINIKG